MHGHYLHLRCQKRLLHHWHHVPHHSANIQHRYEELYSQYLTHVSKCGNEDCWIQYPCRMERWLRTRLCSLVMIGWGSSYRSRNLCHHPDYILCPHHLTGGMVQKVGKLLHWVGLKHQCLQCESKARTGCQQTRFHGSERMVTASCAEGKDPGTPPGNRQLRSRNMLDCCQTGLFLDRPDSRPKKQMGHSVNKLALQSPQLLEHHQSAPKLHIVLVETLYHDIQESQHKPLCMSAN